MLEVILSKSPRPLTLEAVRLSPDHPSMDAAAVSASTAARQPEEAGQSYVYPVLIPPARLARALWPTLLDPCVPGPFLWDGGNLAEQVLNQL